MDERIQKYEEKMKKTDVYKRQLGGLEGYDGADWKPCTAGWG